MSDLLESIRRTEKAREEYDVCPDCGKEYVDLDTTMAGDLVFIHQESPFKTCTVDTDIERSEGSP